MKYIVDIPDEVVEFVGSEMNIFIEPKIKTDGQRHYAFRLSNEDITIYTEPNRKAIEDEVWEFVEKLEYLTVGETEDCFDIEYDGIPFVAGMFSYQEAKEKYEAWLKRKDELHVGDEIILGRDLKMVVIQITDNETTIQGVDENGECYECIELNEVKKTGRHFDEVAELLEKMREDT